MKFNFIDLREYLAGLFLDSRQWNGKHRIGKNHHISLHYGTNMLYYDILMYKM